MYWYKCLWQTAPGNEHLRSGETGRLLACYWSEKSGWRQMLKVRCYKSMPHQTTSKCLPALWLNWRYIDRAVTNTSEHNVQLTLLNIPSYLMSSPKVMVSSRRITVRVKRPESCSSSFMRMIVNSRWCLCHQIRLISIRWNSSGTPASGAWFNGIAWLVRTPSTPSCTRYLWNPTKVL